jgi:hypothetical protein
MVLFMGLVLNFIIVKILVNTTIKNSKLIVLSWCKYDREITS